MNDPPAHFIRALSLEHGYVRADIDASNFAFEVRVDGRAVVIKKKGGGRKQKKLLSAPLQQSAVLSERSYLAADDVSGRRSRRVGGAFSNNRAPTTPFLLLPAAGLLALRYHRLLCAGCSEFGRRCYRFIRPPQVIAGAATTAVFLEPRGRRGEAPHASSGW